MPRGGLIGAAVVGHTSCFSDRGSGGAATSVRKSVRFLTIVTRAPSLPPSEVSGALHSEVSKQSGKANIC